VRGHEDGALPGRLRADIEDQFVIWRPVLEGMVSLEAVETGAVSLERLMQLNGLLDMRATIQREAGNDRS
jgi:hypothetical protein